jgi:two-component system, NtrC family, response regulator
VGNSPAINDCLEQLASSADGEHSLFISGETGTGKELFARAAHLNSHRADKNFVVVDCSALTDSLIESSLFGYVRGAFTDARQDRDGLIKLAHQGTLFLDEVGELPPAIQKKFLRVLEEKRFRPVGSTAEVASDFRLIAASHRNLEKMVKRGAFRKDLLFRIRSQKIILPPLRERKEDIPGLVNHYMARISRRMNIKPKIIQPEFMQCLYDYAWPGNVRELLNVLDQVICSAKNTPILFHKHLPVEIRSAIIRQQQSGTAASSYKLPPSQIIVDDSQLSPWQDFRKTVIRNAEKEYFARLMDVSEGDIRQMTKIAGISKSRVYDLINKHRADFVKPDNRNLLD